MLFPQRALVRPRVLASQSDEPLLLEDEILALVGKGARGLVYVLGPPGSGKTTALRHLATVLPVRAGVVLSDDDDPATAEALHASSGCLVVCAAATPEARPFLAAYHLAPWGDDELIEYLLAAHPAQCAAVMARLSSDDRRLLHGLPELWRVVLDQLASDPSLTGARQVLDRYARALIGPRNVRTGRPSVPEELDRRLAVSTADAQQDRGHGGNGQDSPTPGGAARVCRPERGGRPAQAGQGQVPGQRAFSGVGPGDRRRCGSRPAQPWIIC